MTWLEFRAALNTVDLALIPAGATEQHGHGGTITLEAETFMAVFSEVIDSLYRHGLRRFFILNAHGGNRDGLDLLINAVRDRYPDLWIGWVQISGLIPDIRDPDGRESPLMGHACEREFSQSLYLAPWTVRREALGPSNLTERAAVLHHPAVKRGKTWDEITHDGGLGNSANASYELGERMIETALDRLSSWLQSTLG